MLKKYISGEPGGDMEGSMVPAVSKDGTILAVSSVIHQDFDPALGEVPDLEGYRDIKLGEELPENQ